MNVYELQFEELKAKILKEPENESYILDLMLLSENEYFFKYNNNNKLRSFINKIENNITTQWILFELTLVKVNLADDPTIALSDVFHYLKKFPNDEKMFDMFTEIIFEHELLRNVDDKFTYLIEIIDNDILKSKYIIYLMKVIHCNKLIYFDYFEKYDKQTVLEKYFLPYLEKAIDYNNNLTLKDIEEIYKQNNTIDYFEDILLFKYMFLKN